MKVVFISSYDAKVGDFVLHYLGNPLQVELPGHYAGNGRGQFTNVAEGQSLALPMLPMGANFGDLNNDGYLDFYLGTGEPNISVIIPNMMFLHGRGKRFHDITMAGGFGHLQKGHAIVFADFDEDGDQDIFEQMGGAKRVDKYRDALYQKEGQSPSLDCGRLLACCRFPVPQPAAGTRFDDDISFSIF